MPSKKLHVRLNFKRRRQSKNDLLVRSSLRKKGLHKLLEMNKTDSNESDLKGKN